MSVANISRNSFNESKQYDKVILQQGVPLTDYDFNEAQDIQRVKLRRILKELFGDGAIGDGFKVVAQATPDNTVIVKAGTLYVQGYRVNKSTDITVTMPAPPTSGTRTDYVYVDVTESEVDSVMDPDIVHPKLTMEPTRRIKISSTIQVGTSVPLDTDTHKYYTLAEVTRTAGKNVIDSGDIKDRRAVKATFEGEGFSVKGGVTLGDEEIDTIDVRGRIVNTSNTFGGVIYIDDNVQITGQVTVANRGTFTGDLRTSANLYVNGAIINDTTNNGGKVKINDDLWVTGLSTFDNTVTVNSGGQTSILSGNDLSFNKASGSATITNKGSNGGLTFVVNNTSQALILNGDASARFTGNLTLDRSLTVAQTTTLNGGLTLNGDQNTTGMTTLTKDSNLPLKVIRTGTGGNALEVGNGTGTKAYVTSTGDVTAVNANFSGNVVATGRIVQTGKYYEVAKFPLFGVAGDIQYQSDSTTWEDVTPFLLWLFDFSNNRTMLPPVPSGATRKYKLRMAYAQSDATKQISVRLITTDLATTALTWTPYAFTTSNLDGSRIYQESPEFTQGDTTKHWKIQAMITGGEMTIHWIELVAYDVY